MKVKHTKKEDILAATPSMRVKKTETQMFEKHVVDGIAFFSFKSYDDMVRLRSSENLQTSLVPIKEVAPGEVSSECIQNLPAIVSKNSISATPPNGQPTPPLVNGVEPSTITLPTSAMDPCTSSSLITMEPRMITPSMATAFSNTNDLYTSQSVLEHNGLNQHIENLDECMNFRQAQSSYGNDMRVDWLLKKVVNVTFERNEEKNNSSRLEEDYKKLENKNATLVRQNITLNTKYHQAANENQYLKNEIDAMKITLNHNPKSNEMELSRLVEILKNVSNEFNIAQKLENLINEKTELENQLKEHLEKNQALTFKYLDIKAKAKKFKEHILRHKYPTLEETIMVPFDEDVEFDNSGVSNNMTETFISSSSKRKDSKRKTDNSEAKKFKQFIDLTADDSQN